MTYLKNEETNQWVHREIYEMNISKIPKGYHVHHIDKNPINNSLDNLIAIPEEFHTQLHDLDKAGVICRNKSDVSLALAFYLRGKRNNRLVALTNAVENSKPNHSKKNKKQKRIHYSSLVRGRL
jgi:hypothetical protein